MTKRWLFLGALCLFTACSSARDIPYSAQIGEAEPVYDYPVQNPYAATILGVPESMAASDTSHQGVLEPQEKTLHIFPDRKIPEGFWYEDGLRYGQLLQKHPAPLVYLIAGTGADNRASQMRQLANVLYGAGFSVALLPSPSHQNFIINASHNFIANRPIQSARDMYRVMGMVDRAITKQTMVTGRMVSGYSLGALDAAFVAKLDDERHELNFSRVLLINPPLRINSSIQKIDGMLYRRLPNGIDDANGFIEKQLKLLSNASRSGNPLDFSSEKQLMKTFNTYKPDDETLASIVGLAFRMTSANLTFASDVMSHSGYIFPKDQPFTTSTDLNSYMSLALRTSLGNYFNDIYVPTTMAENPGITREQVLAESGLESIRGYLTSSGKFGMITNRDDIILSPGELPVLEAIFPQHKVFPNGGHLGNLSHAAVRYDIVKFLKEGSL